MKLILKSIYIWRLFRLEVKRAFQDGRLKSEDWKRKAAITEILEDML